MPNSGRSMISQRGYQPTTLPIFTHDCMKMKTFWPGGHTSFLMITSWYCSDSRSQIQALNVLRSILPGENLTGTPQPAGLEKGICSVLMILLLLWQTSGQWHANAKKKEKTAPNKLWFHIWNFTSHKYRNISLATNKNLTKLQTTIFVCFR